MKANKSQKFNMAVIALTVFLQILLAATPFMNSTRDFWAANSFQELCNELATFIGIQFVLFTGSVALILAKTSADQSTAMDDLQRSMPMTIIDRLTDIEFYVRFRCAVEEAQSSVWIAYLAPYPPTDVNYKNRRVYYDEILDLMKKRSDVSFRRIIRSTPRNEIWAAEIVEALKNRPNVEVALLRHDLPPEREMPLTLSVQVIDQKKVWLVAIGAHEPRGSYRDIYVQNDDLASALAIYYDRVWQASEVVLDRGRITPAGDALVNKVRNSQ